jgi:hypothetical protein
MPNRKPRNGLVGVSFYIDPQTLDLINETVEGKNQSEKIRKLVTLGLQTITSKE